MILKYTQKKLTWIDLESPTHEEIREIMSEYNIHPLVAQELVGPTLRPKVEIYPNFIYLILHFPTLVQKHSKGLIEQQEIDFIIGKDFLITSRYGKIDPLQQFSKMFEVNSILDRSEMNEHAGFVFFYMIRALYERLSSELEYVNESIHSIEDKIFKGRERAMVIKISEVSREILGVRRATALHKEVLESFDIAARRFFGDSFAYHTKAISGEYCKLSNQVESCREAIAELRETNNSLLDTRETETMKRLTIIAFLTLPASVITNFFQMGTSSTPIVGMPNDWLILMLIMFCGTLILFALGKWKKWY